LAPELRLEPIQYSRTPVHPAITISVITAPLSSGVSVSERKIVVRTPCVTGNVALH
jgi:hypothetical protein